MKELISFIHHLIHEQPEWAIGILFVVWWIFGAAAHALPEPDAATGKGYRFLYNFIHYLFANASKVPFLGRLVNGGTKNAAKEGL